MASIYPAPTQVSERGKRSPDGCKRAAHGYVRHRERPDSHLDVVSGYATGRLWRLALRRVRRAGSSQPTKDLLLIQTMYKELMSPAARPARTWTPGLMVGRWVQRSWRPGKHFGRPLTRIQPTPHREVPLFTLGTAARIERIRLLYQRDADRQHEATAVTRPSTPRASRPPRRYQPGYPTPECPEKPGRQRYLY